MKRISRRNMARGMLVGSLFALGAAGAGVVGTMLYPRKSDRREIVVPAPDVPRAGDPPRYVPNGRFFLVNIGSRPSDDVLLALYDRCTHLHCSVRWRDDFRISGQDGTRFFVCPCHGGVFSSSGERIFGPPPRSLDTLPLRVTSFGDVVVDVTRTRPGSGDNLSRAGAWEPRS